MCHDVQVVSVCAVSAVLVPCALRSSGQVRSHSPSAAPWGRTNRSDSDGENWTVSVMMTIWEGKSHVTLIVLIIMMLCGVSSHVVTVLCQLVY